MNLNNRTSSFFTKQEKYSQDRSPSPVNPSSPVSGLRGRTTLNDPNEADSDSTEQLQLVRQKYLELILKHEAFFIDPVTCQLFNVDQHCIPVHLMRGTRDDMLDFLENSYLIDDVDELLARKQKMARTEIHGISDEEFSIAEDRNPLDPFSLKPDPPANLDYAAEEDVEIIQDAVDYLSKFPKLNHIILGSTSSGKTSLMRMARNSERGCSLSEFFFSHTTSPLSPPSSLFFFCCNYQLVDVDSCEKGQRTA